MAGRVLITGATGFIGRRLAPFLRDSGCEVVGIGRAETGPLSRDTDWRRHVDGVDAVVHLAGATQAPGRRRGDAIEAYRQANLFATAGLVDAAQLAGVRRLIYLSSAKVMGEEGVAFGAGDEPEPADPYSVSKAEAEFALRDRAGAMEAVILRPPAVYGPGVKGNILGLLKAVDRGVPLPLARIDNRRSLIGLDNLCDAIRHALDAEPGVYLPSDRDDVSTPELARRVAAALGRPARLFPAPTGVLVALGIAVRRLPAVERLTGTFTVDGLFPGWTPPAGMAQELARTAAWYRGGGPGSGAEAGR